MLETEIYIVYFEGKVLDKGSADYPTRTLSLNNEGHHKLFGQVTEKIIQGDFIAVPPYETLRIVREATSERRGIAVIPNGVLGGGGIILTQPNEKAESERILKTQFLKSNEMVVFGQKQNGTFNVEGAIIRRSGNLSSSIPVPLPRIPVIA